MSQFQMSMNTQMLNKCFQGTKSIIYLFTGHFAKTHGLKCGPAQKLLHFGKKN